MKQRLELNDCTQLEPLIISKKDSYLDELSEREKLTLEKTASELYQEVSRYIESIKTETNFSHGVIEQGEGTLCYQLRGETSGIKINVPLAQQKSRNRADDPIEIKRFKGFKFSILMDSTDDYLWEVCTEKTNQGEIKLAIKCDDGDSFAQFKVENNKLIKIVSSMMDHLKKIIPTLSDEEIIHKSIQTNRNLLAITEAFSKTLLRNA